MTTSTKIPTYLCSNLLGVPSPGTNPFRVGGIPAVDVDRSAKRISTKLWPLSQPPGCRQSTGKSTVFMESTEWTPFMEGEGEPTPYCDLIADGVFTWERRREGEDEDGPLEDRLTFSVVNPDNCHWKNTRIKTFGPFRANDVGGVDILWNYPDDGGGPIPITYIDVIDELVTFSNSRTAYLNFTPTGNVTYRWIQGNGGTASFSGGKITLPSTTDVVMEVNYQTYTWTKDEVFENPAVSELYLYDIDVTPGMRMDLVYEFYNGKQTEQVTVDSVFFGTCCLSGGTVRAIIGDYGSVDISYVVEMQNIETKPTLKEREEITFAHTALGFLNQFPVGTVDYGWKEGGEGQVPTFDQRKITLPSATTGVMQVTYSTYFSYTTCVPSDFVQYEVGDWVIVMFPSEAAQTLVYDPDFCDAAIEQAELGSGGIIVPMRIAEDGA